MVTTDLREDGKVGFDVCTSRELWLVFLKAVIFMHMKPNENWIFYPDETYGFFSRQHMLKLFKFTFSDPLHIDCGVYSIP